MISDMNFTYTNVLKKNSLIIYKNVLQIQTGIDSGRNSKLVSHRHMCIVTSPSTATLTEKKKLP